MYIPEGMDGLTEARGERRQQPVGLALRSKKPAQMRCLYEHANGKPLACLL